MKIGIDARFYGPKVGGGGLGRYVAELVTNLQELDTQHEYVLFLKKENFHACKITNPRFTKQLIDIPWYTVQEQLKMPAVIKRAQVDLMHYPHWNIPVFSRTPFIVTIHDLILLQDKQSARSSTRGALVHGFKYAGFRTVLENAIHRSQHILTVSQYTKDQILTHFGIHEDKITVTQNGISVLESGNDVHLPNLGVHQPYFLYVGNAYPHKNLEMMMHAFAQFRDQHKDVQLVIAGRRDMFSHQLEKEAKELGIPKGLVRFIDLPTDEEIAKLYKEAHLFIYPSRLEGFGMPPLEAMTYGTPVAAARASSLPELLKDQVHYFDPDDIEALVTIMTDALQRPEHIRQFSQTGKTLAASYNWKTTAQQTLDTYNSLSSLYRHR
jgi:glycosyltransferase involved in cell wall biosynthesis